MSRFFKQVVLFTLLCALCNVVDCITIRITCRAKGVELELFRSVIKEWEDLTGNTVEIVTLPHSSNECLALYKQWLGAGTFDVDILQMDIAWLGVFSENLEDLKKYLTSYEVKNISDDCFSAILNSMYDNDRLVALPAYTDCEVMYYRKDLLEKYNQTPPETWQELYETAKLIQKKERESNKRFVGYVFQAKAFEMLTCNFTQLIDSFGGAIVVNGKAEVNSSQCKNAFVFLMRCLEDTSTKSVLNYSEEEARGLFQVGNALFMNSWPYAWSLMNDPSTSVSGKIGIMAIPKSDTVGGKPSGVLGGWFFALNKYSKHAGFAAELIKFLTDKKQHKIRAAYAYAPAYKSLYDDPEILKKNPFFSTLKYSLERAVVRPSAEFKKSYPRASTEIFNLVNTGLTESVGEKDKEKIATRYLNRLNRKLTKILNRQVRRKRHQRESIFTRIAKSCREFLNSWGV
ncbi:MAG: ABC transporter substrate-binding protein [Alphaproteobacteria bacterium]|nr:ABC transporter substrate-binding protein [Alphaproteobacteria bacterium]